MMLGRVGHGDRGGEREMTLCQRAAALLWTLAAGR